MKINDIVDVRNAFDDLLTTYDDMIFPFQAGDLFPDELRSLSLHLSASKASLIIFKTEFRGIELLVENIQNRLQKGIQNG